MIPKIIHYCWFGRTALPRSAKKCIASWRNYFPDYEIKEWNEDNFDVNIIPYTHFCYEHKLWAYLSDYVRLFVVNKFGGWYFDTDVEIVRFPIELLEEEALFGWEPSNWVATGLGFAAKKGHMAIQSLLLPYNEFKYEQLLNRYSETRSLTGCPRMNTNQLLKYGLVQDGTYQHFYVDSEKVLILPKDYMCPFDDITGRLRKTKNTFSIHWYTKSANGKWAYYKAKLSRLVHRLFEYLKKNNYDN